jgi:hypothetical protein
MELGHCAVRGAIGAMAMTGLRTVTAGLGLLEKPPPDAITEATYDHVLRRLRVDRDVVVELSHWAFGATAGAVFGALPSPIRHQRWAGPAYGLGVWIGFETVLAPLLGTDHVPRRKVVGRAMLLADHLLYGLVLGGTAWPHRA